MQTPKRFIKYIAPMTGRRLEPRSHLALIDQRAKTLCGINTKRLEKDKATFLPLPVSCSDCKTRLKKHWPVRGRFFVPQ